MPDRARNRPRNRHRIAGQRRRDEDTPLAGEVTPTTTETPAEITPSPTSITERDPSPAPGNPGDEAPESASADDADDATAGASAGAEAGSEVATPSSASARRSRRVGVVLTAALAVLIVLVLGLAGVLGVKAYRGQQAEEARGEAVAAGRKAAETALSYDYRTLDKSFADARATMTPEFAAKFDETAKVAGELATKTKATVRAEVREVGVRDGDTDRVTLIIFVNQTTTSTITQGKPRVDLNRTRFTMARFGSRWLVQEVVGL